MLKYSEAEIKQLTHNIPETVYPRKIEDWYANQLIKLVNEWKKQAIAFTNLYLRKYIKQGSLKLDAEDDSYFERLSQDIDLLAFSLEQAGKDPKLTPMVTKFVKSIDSVSYRSVKMQAAIVGLDPIREDQALKNYVKGKIAENTMLIKSMNTNYATALQKDIYRSITKGDGVTTVTKAIVDRTHMTANHAKLIANDQTASIISQLDAYRSKRAGARKYIWRSMEDNRVRPRHRELDGTEQRYDDPNGGDNGQMPGEPIRCRCVALPVFGELDSEKSKGTSISSNEAEVYKGSNEDQMLIHKKVKIYLRIFDLYLRLNTIYQFWVRQ